MKKILLTCFLLSVIIGTASAQMVGKGNFYIGGNLNYNYDQAGTSSINSYPSGTTYYYNQKITNFSISPDFGFFLTNKLAIGIQLGYNHISGTEYNYYVASDNTTTSYQQTDTYNTNAIGIGLHLRYYWMLTDRVGFFPQVGVNTSNNTSDFNYGTLSIGGNPNLVFFATKKLAVNLGFGNLEYDLDYKSKTHTFNFGLNTNIGFGLNYYW